VIITGNNSIRVNLAKRFGLVDLAGTPSLALFLCAIVSIALVLGGSFDTLVAVGSIFYVAGRVTSFGTASTCGTPTMPDEERSILRNGSSHALRSAGSAIMLNFLVFDLRDCLGRRRHSWESVELRRLQRAADSLRLKSLH
jgi:hypothetical protein